MTQFVPAVYEPFPGYRETEFETVNRLYGVNGGNWDDIKAGTQNGVNGFYVSDATYAAYQDDLRRYSGGVHVACCPQEPTWYCNNRKCEPRKIPVDLFDPAPIKIKHLGNYCMEIDPTDWVGDTPVSYSMGGIWGPASGYGRSGVDGGRDANGPVRASGPVKYCFPGPGPGPRSSWNIIMTPTFSACAGIIGWWASPRP